MTKKPLYNDKGDNPALRYNICEYICTQNGSAKKINTNINRPKGRN